MREVVLGEGRSIKVEEQWELENDAGAVVWDAALVLSYFLLHSQDIVGHAAGTGLLGKSVVEIGAGTGLVGLVAAALGAGPVILTDLSHLVAYMGSNAALNGLSDGVSAMELEWGNAAHIASVLKHLARIAVVKEPRLSSPAPSCTSGQFEQRPATLAGKAGSYYPDIILGSDLIYKLSELDSLFFTLALMSGPETTIMLCQEYRPGTEAFHEVAKTHGFVEQQLPEEHLHPEWRSEDIQIYVLKKAEPEG